MLSERFTVDDLARPVPIGPGARRIVSIAPSATECVLAIGAGDRLVGVERRSAPYLAACRARLRAVVERTMDARVRPLTYVEFSPAGHTGGPGSFLDDLVVKAGGVNLGGAARVEWPVLSAATVSRFDPDVIVIARYSGSATPETLMAREGWGRLTAVKCGRVWELPGALIKRPGPGAVDGVERLAEILACASA